MHKKYLERLLPVYPILPLLDKLEVEAGECCCGGGGAGEWCCGGGGAGDNCCGGGGTGCWVGGGVINSWDP